MVTPRLDLRLASPSEASLVVDYFERNREHLRAWEPRSSLEGGGEDAWRHRLERMRVDQENGRHIRFHLFERVAKEPRIIGVVGLSNVVRGAFECAHLGFSIDQKREGTGMMREAVEAVIRFAFSPLGLHRLEANHQPHNLRSAALLRRLGFQPTGFARDYLFIDGAWRDHVQTALINADWTPPG